MKFRTLLGFLILTAMLFSVCASSAPCADEATDAWEICDEYPRTKMNYLQKDCSFYETSAEARTIHCMIIPVHFTDGYGYDDYDFFCAQVDKMMNGTEVYSARQYYINASYGMIDLQYEIMPVYEVGMSSWDMENKWYSTPDFYWYTEHYWQIYDSTRAAYKGDLSKFDTDNDGYADIVIMVFDDPSVDGISKRGTLYGGKVVSLSYNRIAHNADHNYPSCCHAICLERYQMMPDDGKGESWRWENDEITNWMVLNHELGHMFGVPDLYCIDTIEPYTNHNPLGFDLHVNEMGDLNSWTKLSFGWIDPYVITPDVEKATLRLRCSALYPDCILIPTSKGWNGSPFDEFMLVEVFAKAGNNTVHWDDQLTEFTSQTDPARQGGVRILHIDQRMAYAGGGWFDPSRDKVNRKSIVQIHSANTMSIGIAVSDSPDKDNAFYYNIHAMTRSGKDPLFLRRENQRGYFDFCACDLFIPGSSFSMESHSSAFANAPYMNNHGTLDYAVTVESYDPQTMEAIVTVERITDELPPQLITVLSGTNVRQTADTSGAIVGMIEAETELEYLDLENGWYRVRLDNGTIGYVYQSRVVSR